MKLLKYLILILSLSISAQGATLRHRSLKAPSLAKWFKQWLKEQGETEPEPAGTATEKPSKKVSVVSTRESSG
jgi:hypothetical protein